MKGTLINSWPSTVDVVISKTGLSPALLRHPGHLNDSFCNSSSTEAGVLIAYHQNTARPIPKEVRIITGRGIQRPSITIPQGKRVPAYLSGGHSSVYSGGL
ncbi:hypothetical protein AVEN_42975-1 [Araneus ventricosus]|uniref:Uncharacterized protein n=1 Tax=Araneus ventricosus TaxID=182803 RepID=A0A4Y2AF60_ARAVE|nr:hypothetical protein AVEN_42975-1 [Araneus ventricosus]